MHPMNVLRRRLDPYQHHFLAAFGKLLCLVSIEHDLARGRTRRSWQACRQNIALSLRVKRWVQQLVERHGIDAQDRFLLVNQSLAHHLDRHLERSLGRALA